LCTNVGVIRHICSHVTKKKRVGLIGFTVTWNKAVSLAPSSSVTTDLPKQFSRLNLRNKKNLYKKHALQGKRPVVFNSPHNWILILVFRTNKINK
jgi:hypothetical protein